MSAALVRIIKYEDVTRLHLIEWKSLSDVPDTWPHSGQVDRAGAGLGNCLAVGSEYAAGAVFALFHDDCNCRAQQGELHGVGNGLQAVPDHFNGDWIVVFLLNW